MSNEKEEQIVRLKDVWPCNERRGVNADVMKALTAMFGEPAATAGVEDIVKGDYGNRNVSEVGGRDYSTYPTSIPQLLLLAAAIRKNENTDLNWSAPGMLVLLLFFSFLGDSESLRKMFKGMASAERVAPGFLCVLDQMCTRSQGIGTSDFSVSDSVVSEITNALLKKPHPFSVMRGAEGWDMPIGYAARRAVGNIGLGMCQGFFSSLVKDTNMEEVLSAVSYKDNPNQSKADLLVWMCAKPYTRIRQYCAHHDITEVFGPKTLDAIRKKFPFALPENLDASLRGEDITYELLDYVKQADTSGIVEADRMTAYIQAHTWCMDHNPIHHYSERRLALRIMSYAYLAPHPLEYVKRIVKRNGDHINRTVYLATDGAMDRSTMRQIVELFEARGVTAVITTCVTMV